MKEEGTSTVLQAHYTTTEILTKVDSKLTITANKSQDKNDEKIKQQNQQNQTKNNQHKIQQQKQRFSMLAVLIGSKNITKTKMSKCGICLAQFKVCASTTYLCDCPHKYQFCQSCIHYYLIFKTQKFQQIKCPSETCDQFISTETPFFKNLPLNMQTRVGKITRFYLSTSDPNLKLCPKDSCEGILTKQDSQSDDSLICKRCQSIIYPKCYQIKHEGDCDKQVVEKFKLNSKYRQCKKCKFFIEKNSGCNHMVCRCKHEFCFVCGEDWSEAHYRIHNKGSNHQIINNRNQTINTTPNSCLYIIMMFIMLFLFKWLWFYVLSFLLSIMNGFRTYTCQFIMQKEFPQFMIYILLFPVSAAVGLKRGFDNYLVTDHANIVRQIDEVINRQLIDLLCLFISLLDFEGYAEALL